MKYIKKIFNFIGSIKAMLILFNMMIIIFISLMVIKSDLFYVISQTFVENNFKESKQLVKYIENARIENFYGDRPKYDKNMNNINDFWSYTPIKNRAVYFEFKEKITNEDDLKKVMDLFNDLDNFYFDLLNYKYKFDKEGAFYELKKLLENHKCKIYQLEKKYKIDWHKTIVSSVNGLVYETLFYTQIVNGKESENENRLDVIMRKGSYFSQILMPDKCIDLK